MFTCRRFIIFFVLILGVATTSSGQTVIIINATHPASEATAEQIADIFLGNTTTLAGASVIPIDQKKLGDTGTAFLTSIVKMSEGEYNSIWVEKMLSGEATPPDTKNSDAEVIGAVKSTPGGIGFVSANSDLSGVKVIQVDGKTEF